MQSVQFHVVLKCQFQIMKYMLYSKTCVNGHPNLDKTKILMTNGSFMKVKRIAECYQGNNFRFIEWLFYTGFTILCFVLVIGYIRGAVPPSVYFIREEWNVKTTGKQ